MTEKILQTRSAQLFKSNKLITSFHICLPVLYFNRQD